MNGRRVFRLSISIRTPVNCVSFKQSPRFPIATPVRACHLRISECIQTGGSSSDERRAPIAAHVLFASFDEGCAGTSDPGTCRASRPRNDAAIHAPESGGGRKRDQTVG